MSLLDTVLLIRFRHINYLTVHICTVGCVASYIPLDQVEPNKAFPKSGQSCF